MLWIGPSAPCAIRARPPRPASVLVLRVVPYSTVGQCSGTGRGGATTECCLSYILYAAIGAGSSTARQPLASAAWISPNAMV